MIGCRRCFEPLSRNYFCLIPPPLRAALPRSAHKRWTALASEQNSSRRRRRSSRTTLSWCGSMVLRLAPARYGTPAQRVAVLLYVPSDGGRSAELIVVQGKEGEREGGREGALAVACRSVGTPKKTPPHGRGFVLPQGGFGLVARASMPRVRYRLTVFFSCVAVFSDAIYRCTYVLPDGGLLERRMDLLREPPEHVNSSCTFPSRSSLSRVVTGLDP